MKLTAENLNACPYFKYSEEDSVIGWEVWDAELSDTVSITDKDMYEVYAIVLIEDAEACVVYNNDTKDVHQYGRDVELRVYSLREKL